MSTSVRPLLLRLHFYAGILVGPFLLIAALSGVLYALSPQLDKIVYSALLTPADPGAAAIPLARQVAAAQAVTTVQGLVAVRPAPDDGTTRVIFDDGTFAESYRHAVFVDPGTGTILGQQTVYGTTGALPVRSWIGELHRTLHLGAPGRYYSELAASWLWVVTLGGLALWIDRARTRRSVRTALVPDRSLRGRARTRSWHAVIGIWSVLGLLMLSATGLTWSRFAGENVTALRTSLSWSTPSVNTALTATTATGHAEHTGHTGHSTATPVSGTAGAAVIDGVWSAARGAGVDSDQVEIALPASDGSAWTVTEVHRAYPTSVDAAAVDPVTLKVTDTVRFADYPVMAKLARWGVDLHMGTLFGPANQIVLALLALGLTVMIVLGYRMWWQRRPTRGSSRALVGAPPAQGTWRRVPRRLIAVGAPAVAAVAWLLPLLGASLIAFVVADLATGAARRTRSG